MLSIITCIHILSQIYQKHFIVLNDKKKIESRTFENLVSNN